MLCERCSSLCASRTQIVLPDMPETGHFFRVLVVGEAPGADEDAQGRGFVGRAGRTLHTLMEDHGFVRGQDYGCANLVRCRPPDNRRPSRAERDNCFGYLLDTISAMKPKAILAVGDSAASAFTGHAGLMDNINRLTALDYSPFSLFERGSPLDMRWPYGTKLFAIPHTSPLAWNRNAPDGRKWAQIGRVQIGKLVKLMDPHRCFQAGEVWADPHGTRHQVLRVENGIAALKNLDTQRLSHRPAHDLGLNHLSRWRIVVSVHGHTVQATEAIKNDAV